MTLAGAVNIVITDCGNYNRVIDEWPAIIAKTTVVEDTTRNVEFTESRYPQNILKMYTDMIIQIIHQGYSIELSWHSLFLSFLVHSGYIPKLEIGYISLLRMLNISGGGSGQGHVGKMDQ